VLKLESALSPDVSLPDVVPYTSLYVFACPLMSVSRLRFVACYAAVQERHHCQLQSIFQMTSTSTVHAR